MTVRKTLSSIISQRYSSSVCPSFHPHGSKCQYSCNTSNLCLFCSSTRIGMWGDFCFGVLTCGKKSGEVKVCVVREKGFIHEDTIPVTGTVEEGMSLTHSLIIREQIPQLFKRKTIPTRSFTILLSQTHHFRGTYHERISKRLFCDLSLINLLIHHSRTNPSVLWRGCMWGTSEIDKCRPF